ncbi:Biopolymer transport protein [Hahella chejuensis KCTC 2396]|uniref:Biopolymer transport protein n=1 Tax=Hahella chejuensis (strain KCTC 2396) TaxID=349521 RepID=Q2SIV2_HAHCH|nr:biopolymer transporter ExbD [Hahella chejuensis]ABC29422.1 Biopolymer transport protein [Hahella chejuensis KCTC 2396]
MKQSGRAKRYQRHYRRMHKTASLNLVSLMDIFTILVFFLMVNSSDVQVLKQSGSVQLPVSIADQPPTEQLTVTVTDDDILVGGRVVSKVAVASNQEPLLINGLKLELDYQVSRVTTPVPPEGRPITIMADKELPYKLLKKIMSTCVEAGYSSISLAVRRAADKEA